MVSRNENISRILIIPNLAQLFASKIINIYRLWEPAIPPLTLFRFNDLIDFLSLDSHITIIQTNS